MITDDGSSLAPLLAKSILKKSWKPIILKFSGISSFINNRRKAFPKETSVIELSTSKEEELQSSFKSIVEKYGEIGGFIHLHPNLKNSSDIKLEDGANFLLKQVFLSAKNLYPYLNKSSKSGTRHCFFLAVTRMDGELGMGSGKFCAVSSGLAGLIKTASVEWSDVFCRFVDFHSEMKAEKVSDYIFQEMNDSDLRLKEVGYRFSEKSRIRRMTVLPKKIRKINSGEKEKTLTTKSVFLVSGGGKGVTAECLVKLTEEIPCKFILLGRSPLEDEPEWAKSVSDDERLKQKAMNFIIENGEKPTPIKVNQLVRKVESGRAIMQNLERIKNAGGEAEYVSVDVTDEKKLKAAISPVIKKFGTVTGLIHGAGVLADKLIEKKTPEDFDTVCSTKINGMDALFKSIDHEKLTHLLIFSSAAGFYGNAGQSDYAMANEALNRIALLFSQKHPDCHVTSFNWGPWEGGMVTPELKRFFEERNVEVISVHDGTRIFVEDVTSKRQSNPIFLIGNSMVVPNKLEEKIGELKILSTINLRNNPVFSDHVIGESPVLPLVHAMSWMSDVCEQRFSGFKLSSCKSFKVLNGIKFDKTKTSQYFLELKEIEEEKGIYKEFEVNVSSNYRKGNTKNNQPRYHYSSIVSLVQQSPKSQFLEKTDMSNTENKPGSSFYEDGTLFHGPKFQGINKLLKINEKGLVLECSLEEISDSEQGQFASHTFNPFAVDLGFQAMLVWSRHYYQSGSLPLKINKFEHFKSVPFKTKFFVNMSINDNSATSLNAEIDIHDEKGLIFCRISGAETTLSKSLNKLFRKK